MSEMKKTTDSCVLHGVPKIRFNREVDGHIQKTPFPMCLQAVLIWPLLKKQVTPCRLRRF